MDAQTWSGLTKLGEVFERLRPRLVSFRDDTGRELFDLPDAPRPDPDAPAPPRYLYDYDNLLLSHASRRRFLDPAVPARIPGTANAYPGTFLVDGFVAGTWEIRRSGGRHDRTTLLVRPAVRLDERDGQVLEAEGVALLAFLAPDGDNGDVRIDAVGDRAFEAERV